MPSSVGRKRSRGQSREDLPLPQPPPAPPWAFSGELSFVAENIELIGSLVAAPFWVLAMQARSFHTSIGALFCAYLAAESWFGASIALLQGSLSPAVWGTAQGLLNMVQVVGNASPILVAALVRRGYALRLVLSLLVPLSYLACALLFGLAGTARKAELE